MSRRYEVVPSKVMRHPDGRTASAYGSHPGDGFELVTVGYTLRDLRTGTVGAAALRYGATREEAEALAAELNASFRVIYTWRGERYHGGTHATPKLANEEVVALREKGFNAWVESWA